MLSEWAKTEITETTKLWAEMYPPELKDAAEVGPTAFVSSLLGEGLTTADPRLALEMTNNRQETEQLFAALLGLT